MILNINQHLISLSSWFLLICTYATPKGAYAGRGQEGQEMPFVLHPFHLSCLVKGHFLAL